MSKRTIVYIDAFNLYFRLLRDAPEFKWLDVLALSKTLLAEDNLVHRVNYYSARVSGLLDPDAPGRQQVYLDAIAAIPEVQIHMGTFLITERWAGLSHPPDFRPRRTLDAPWPEVVKVRRIEEKGSDVNLASHIVRDAFTDAFDVAAILSNDTDLIEPIRIVTEELGKPVGLLSPVSNPSPGLARVASFIRRIRPQHLEVSQLPHVVGGQARPETWQ